MRSVEFRRSALILLLGVVLVDVAVGGLGCHPHRAVAPPGEIPSLLPSADDLVAHLERERARVTGLRTLADSEITGPEGSLRTSEVLLVEPPKRLRIEVLSTFGVAGILATDGEVLDIYAREDDMVYRGKPTPDLIAKYLTVPLALEDLTELLLGRPPRRDVREAASVAWERETGLIRLSLRLRGGGTETIWFDGPTALFVRCEERGPNGDLRFDLRVKTYREVNGQSLGADLTIVAPGGIRLRLAYARSEVNPILPDHLFRLPYVAGASETRLPGPGELP